MFISVFWIDSKGKYQYSYIKDIYVSIFQKAKYSVVLDWSNEMKRMLHYLYQY